MRKTLGSVQNIQGGSQILVNAEKKPRLKVLTKHIEGGNWEKLRPKMFTKYVKCVKNPWIPRSKDTECSLKVGKILVQKTHFQTNAFFSLDCLISGTPRTAHPV